MVDLGRFRALLQLALQNLAVLLQNFVLNVQTGVSFFKIIIIILFVL